MLTALGSLFRSTLRQAQAADTRLEIRRDHDQEQRRQNDRPDGDDDSSSLWEDSTSVSVGALRAFLLEFLAARGVQGVEPSDAQDLLPTYVPPVREPGNPIAAKAMKAYAQTSAQSPPAEPHQAPPHAALPSDNSDLSSLLAQDEITTMRELIRELDLLAARGVQDLTIERADTFLEALVAAVSRARPGP